ncbi:TPA: pyridoxal phosphate-dependent aminotransferase [Salmonella enterica subsp. enterica serovar Typhi]|uniref:cysteine-S-conjugate beta-lyase n=1 Tax=Salmonella typhi TaxID=90370 RepID=A0A751GCL6_SALTI|nr:putative aminotransferase [Salmonella enterica subsp. enterica serovar Paratyphi A]HAF6803435.1 pyridoxal phosphate-dependent aminotransferase [Salmonella enterica subsp. enterica serovar Typhi]
MDFNQIINRNNTGSVKWDFIERHFGDGAGKLLPMWVSDFDFACPPEVQAALHQRIEHGVFGYSERDEAYFNALLHWFSSRHQLTLKQEWVFRHERPPLMILCNPHNPTGRCWSANELEQLLLLCEAYDVTLISDEIWADLLLPGETFTSVLHLGERWHKRVISATAASKTFGLSSLRISNFLIPEPTLRQRFLSRLDAHGLDVFNALSVQAATTAWNESRQWLDSLLDYLAENRRWFVEQATEHLPWARIVPAQGTYLLWMDCKKLGLDDEQLKWVMADVAGIAPSMGSGFGPAGSGFIRLNLGCPRTYLEMAIDGLKRISVKTIKGIPTGG